MTEKKAIEILKSIQNPKVDYADLVGTISTTYGYHYVYPEPEDYAIEEGIKALEEIQQYRGIGTVEECKESVERRTSTKPIYESDGDADGCPVYDTWICPNCETRYGVDYDDYKYCPECGQAINWSEEE